MAKEDVRCPTIEPADLAKVTGGGKMQLLFQVGGKAIEAGRKAVNAAVVGLNLVHPTKVPIKPIPAPKKIERVVPAPQVRPGFRPKDW